MYLRICGSFKFATNKGPQIATANRKKIFGPQIPNPQNDTIAEGPQI